MRSFGIDELMAVERLFNLACSPTRDLAFLCTKSINLKENTSKTRNYRLNLQTNELLPIDLGPGGATSFCFTPDGEKLFYACDGQIYLANGDGTNPRCISSGVGGASTPVVSADGKRVLFARDVYVNDELQELFEAKSSHLSLAQAHGLCHPLAEARIADELLYRHWDTWRDKRRNALFLLDVETQNLRRVANKDMDCPPIALGSERDYDISPCGNYIVFTANPDAFLANSTNNSVFYQRVGGEDGAEAAVCISNSRACDSHPRFLDENTIVYLAMQEPGYEADYNRIKLYDVNSKETRCFLQDFERSPDDLHIVAPNVILFSAQDFAHASFYELKLDTGEVLQLSAGSTYSRPCVRPKTREILCIHQSLTQAAECVLLSNLTPFSPELRNGHETKSNENLRRYTRFSDVFADAGLRAGKPLCYEAKDGTILEGYVVLPPNYDENSRYPMILLIHGGPQGAFLDSFHYRWNVQMFAATGAIVAFCNPRGSTGYGRKITREISNDWSGNCPDDILTFVDRVIESYPQVDPNRLCAAGASFGGYMVNYLMGVTDRFKAFVSHDGIFHAEISGYVTDELWFTEKEFNARPYENAENYTRHSPHLNVKNFKTPCLVIHGERDYRCCINESVALFCALQYMGVESRLLTFPNEGHWVLSPANAQQWYHEVLGWLVKHTF